jgi:hypothetical protein
VTHLELDEMQASRSRLVLCAELAGFQPSCEMKTRDPLLQFYARQP